MTNPLLINPLQCFNLERQIQGITIGMAKIDFNIQRRNEVWVQADDGEAADVSTVVHKLLHEELPHHENHPHPHQ